MKPAHKNIPLRMARALLQALATLVSMTFTSYTIK